MLNLGLAWVIMLLSPVLLLIGYAMKLIYHNRGYHPNGQIHVKKKHTIILDDYLIVQYSAVWIWLIVLFTRPHKVIISSIVWYLIWSNVMWYDVIWCRKKDFSIPSIHSLLIVPVLVWCVCVISYPPYGPFSSLLPLQLPPPPLLSSPNPIVIVPRVLWRERKEVMWRW